MLWVAARQLLLSMVDTVSLFYAEAVECTSSAESDGMLCSEIVMLLNMADTLYAGRVVSEQL